MTGLDVYRRIRHNLGVLTFEERVERCHRYEKEITDYLTKYDLYTDLSAKLFLEIGACVVSKADGYISRGEFDSFCAIFDEEFTYESLLDFVKENSTAAETRRFMKEFASIKSPIIARTVIYFLYLFASADYFLDEKEDETLVKICDVFVSTFYETK